MENIYLLDEVGVRRITCLYDLNVFLGICNQGDEYFWSQKYFETISNRIVSREGRNDKFHVEKEGRRHAKRKFLFVERLVQESRPCVWSMSNKIFHKNEARKAIRRVEAINDEGTCKFCHFYVEIFSRDSHSSSHCKMFSRNFMFFA